MGERLEAAEGSTLQYSSWMDVHKAFAGEGVIPNSADGLRGTQLAVDLLIRQGHVKCQNGEMSLAANNKRLTGQDLEIELFPDEFEFVMPNGSDGDGEGWDDDTDDEDVDGYAGSDADSVQAGPTNRGANSNCAAKKLKMKFRKAMLEKRKKEERKRAEAEERRREER